MPQIGPLELIILLVVVLLIFGPKRLPSLGRQLGGGLREFKESVTGDKRRDEDEDDARPTLAEGRPQEPAARPPEPAARPQEPAAAPAPRTPADAGPDTRS